MTPIIRPGSIAHAFEIFKETVLDENPHAPKYFDRNDVDSIAEMAFFGGATAIVSCLNRGLSANETLAHFKSECESKAKEWATP